MTQYHRVTGRQRSLPGRSAIELPPTPNKQFYIVPCATPAPDNSATVTSTVLTLSAVQASRRREWYRHAGERYTSCDTCLDWYSEDELFIQCHEESDEQDDADMKVFCETCFHANSPVA